MLRNNTADKTQYLEAEIILNCLQQLSCLLQYTEENTNIQTESLATEIQTRKTSIQSEDSLTKDYPK